MSPILNIKARLTAVAFAAVPLLSCSGATEPACSGVLTITAASTTQPTFSWTPNCRVDQLYVEEEIVPSAGGPQPRWIIESRVLGRGTPSPVTYGRVPFLTMREVLAPVNLVVGHQYRVIVRDSNMSEIGNRVFSPSAATNIRASTGMTWAARTAWMSATTTSITSIATISSR
jgi:hypothetical protein